MLEVEQTLKSKSATKKEIVVKPKLKGVIKHGALNLKFASGSDTIPIDLTIIQ